MSEWLAILTIEDLLIIKIYRKGLMYPPLLNDVNIDDVIKEVDNAIKKAMGHKQSRSD